MNLKERLFSHLEPYGQQHLLAFWAELSPRQQQDLAVAIESIDLPLIDRLFRHGADHEDWLRLAEIAESPPAVRWSDAASRSLREQARARGEQALACGKVAAVLVAGGQGTRLGFSQPKGLFPIGPISAASLLQIHIEKLIATARRFGSPVPLYLMTSPATHRPTVEFLEAHGRFGLAANELVVFCQGTMPAVDAASGRLLMEARDAICFSPDGHGGVVDALKRSGALNDLTERGVEQLFYFQVDNPLTPVCDPELIGHHLDADSQITTLVVTKESAEDRMGVAVSVQGKLRIIEYIDLPPRLAQQRLPDGSLRFWAGNLAIHVIDARFLQGIADRSQGLPFHVSRKKVPHIDGSGRRIEPAAENALKFECFVFDLLPAAARALVVESPSEQVFAPLKNEEGSAKETPQWVRERMIRLHRGWLESAGARVAAGVPVEISPLFACHPDELPSRIQRGTSITEPTYFR